MAKYYLTKKRLEELERELVDLKNKKRVEIAEKLKHSKEYGDLSENAEYAQAREEQAVIETRIFELESLVKKAMIIKKAEGGDKIEVGSTVTANKGDKVVCYTIVGAYEAKPEEGRISDQSPLGRSFLGHRVGDSVNVHTPSGEMVYQVTKIE